MNIGRFTIGIGARDFLATAYELRQGNRASALPVSIDQ